jgi:deoxyadenosine/deoxycytidine kinase
LSDDFLTKTIYLKCDIETIQKRILSRGKIDDYQFTKKILTEVEKEYNSEIKKKPNHIWDIFDVSNLDIYDENSMIQIANKFRKIADSEFPVINWCQYG